MDEDFKVTAMRPLRDVLRKFGSLIDEETADAPHDGPCRRCNGTGTEPIRDDRGVIVSARQCNH